ncbi:MAG: amidohydrolase [Ruminococcaceae bacterium]|nr:amidohydrolase [Oscillospiraceae bacterium]
MNLAHLTDVHAHLMLGNVENNRKNLIQTAERYGCSRYYISTIDGNHCYPDEDFIDMDNNATYAFMKDEPDLIKGYVYVNPRNANAMQVLRQGIEDRGMSGLKLWVATHCDDPLTYPVVEKMIEYNKPILIHTFVKAVGQLEHETTSYHVANLAERYPEAKLIMAHLGGEAFHGIRPVAKYKNVWIDHSGTLVGSEDLNHTVRLVGADRVLFGTDMPIAFASSYGQLYEANLTAEEREKIAWKNTAELFGEGF